MKFLKKIASMSEAIQTNVDVLYATDTEIKFTKALPSFTYSVKNISSPSVNWTATSATINFTGVKTFNDGTVEETEETQIVEFEQNTPQGEGTPMDLSNPNLEYVDLGLPSGLKWAKCNLGAQSETEYGAYFQWGDTNGYAQPTDKGGTSTARNITDKFLWNDVEVNYTVKQGGASGGFTWATTPFNNGSNNCNETYFRSVSGTVCPNEVLAAEYDAATVAYGEGYRMPTLSDFTELTANTTSAWFASGNTEFNGVAGRKFTSKTDSTKYIFIPAAGGCGNDSFSSVGSYCHVWTSSLASWGYLEYARCSNFRNGNAGLVNFYRYLGNSVRAVHE